LGRELRTPCHKKKSASYIVLFRALDFSGFFWNYLSNGIWALYLECTSMESYRVGSLKTVERELVKYKLDLVGMQEVVWDTVDTES
jgi:hypothetical protein